MINIWMLTLAVYMAVLVTKFFSSKIDLDTFLVTGVVAVPVFLAYMAGASS